MIIERKFNLDWMKHDASGNNNRNNHNIYSSKDDVVTVEDLEAIEENN